MMMKEEGACCRVLTHSTRGRRFYTLTSFFLIIVSVLLFFTSGRLSLRPGTGRQIDNNRGGGGDNTEFNFSYRPWVTLPVDDLKQVPPNYPAEAINRDHEVAYVNKIWLLKEANKTKDFIIAVRPENNTNRTRARWDQLVKLWREKLPPQIHLRVVFVSGTLPQVIHQLNPRFSWVLIVPEFTYVHVQHVVQNLLISIDPSDLDMRGLVDENKQVRLQAGIVLSYATVQRLLSQSSVDMTDCMVGQSDQTIASRCWPKIGIPWKALAGMHAQHQTFIMSQILDLSFFSNTFEYNSVGGPMQAISTLPLTYGNTTSDEEFYAQLAVDTKTGRFPKVFHHMWIGRKPLAPAVVKMAVECKKMHEQRGWTYILWDDAAVQNLPLAPNLYKTFKKPADPEKYDYHVLSDMMRLFILHVYGGVYTDIDAYCVQPFDGLLEYGNSLHIDFISGYESTRRRGSLIANGVMVSTPSSTAISAAIAQVGYAVWSGTKHGNKISAWLSTGPMLLTKVDRHWKSWLNWKILSQEAFIPIHKAEYGRVKDHQSALEHAKKQGSYTIQLFRGTV